MVAGGIGVGRHRRALRQPVVERVDQVGPGGVLAGLHHGLHERVPDRLTVEDVAVERRLGVVGVVDLLEQRDPAVARVAERGQVAVADDPVRELVAVDLRAALLGERLQQPAQGDGVGADVADDELRREAELDPVELGERGERRDRERHEHLGTRALDRRQLRRDVGVCRLVGLPTDHGRLHLGQVALLVLGELAVERLTDDQVEDGVAEEFHPLVAVEAVIGDGGMGEGLPEEVGVFERVAEDLLGALAQVGAQRGAPWKLKGRSISDKTAKRRRAGAGGASDGRGRRGTRVLTIGRRIGSPRRTNPGQISKT